MDRLAKVRMSIRSQNHLGLIKHRTGLPVNVLARFGLVLSLNDPSMPNPDMYDERGMELLPHILYGRNELLYAMMLQYRLGEDKLDYEKYRDRMARAHVNRGAGMLFPRINGMGDFAVLFRSVMG